MFRKYLMASVLAGVASISVAQAKNASTAQPKGDPAACDALVQDAGDKAEAFLKTVDYGHLTVAMALGDDLEHFEKNGREDAHFDWTPCIGNKYWHNRLALSAEDRRVIAAKGYPAPKPVNPLPDVPNWDVDYNCRNTRNPEPISQQAVNVCTNMEQKSYNTLKVIWNNLDHGYYRNFCLRLANEMPNAPYTALKNCAIIYLNRQEKQREWDRMQTQHTFQR